MSWIGVMVGVGVGAGSSGIMTGVNGGSTEDILKSMAIGGAMGGAGGAIGGALAGPAAGAASGAGGGAASGATTGASTGALTGSTTGTLGAAGNAAATSAITPTLSSAATGAVGGGTTGAVGGGTGGAGFAGVSGGSGLLAGGTGGATGGATGGVSGGGIGSLGASGNQAASNMLSQQAVMDSAGTLPGQSGFVGPTATQGQIANASAYTDANMGTRLLADAFGQQGNIVGNTGLKMAGSALQGGAMNAGISGLMAGARGEDVGEGMAKGAATGMIGGAATGAMSGMDNAVGRFATEHPYITSGGIGLAANMALDKPYEDTTAPEQKGIRSLYKWDNNAYQPYRTMAAGGVTDLDNYDQTPQMQNPGTLDIPNRNEVSNNQGYMGDSVQMMAHGGVSDLGGYSDGGRLLKGPGDGVSDDIPASIGGKQPARLAEGEFVVPARIVSELGNGSTDAGAKRLYQMMDRIQSDRKKTTGKGKFSDNPKAYKHLPA